VVEKIAPGRQPLWDRKNQSRVRLPRRYRTVTLCNHHIQGFRHQTVLVKWNVENIENAFAAA
jgi:hypothetical protein